MVVTHLQHLAAYVALSFSTPLVLLGLSAICTPCLHGMVAFTVPYFYTCPIKQLIINESRASG